MKYHIAFLLLLVIRQVTALTGDVRWFVNHEALGGNSLSVTDEEQTFPLRSGWTCTLSPVSGGWYEARQTVCRKDKEQFEFSVQCESKSPIGHTQVRFRNQEGKLTDLIHVGCEFRE